MDATDGPDKYSHAWYLEQLRGITHLQRLLAANQEDQSSKLAAMVSRVSVLEVENAEKTARIGELLGRLEEMESKHEVMAKWLREKFAKNGAAA